MENKNLILELDLVKGGKTSSGNVKMRGIASTNREDLQKDTLLPSGFDCSMFMEHGFMNWNHQSNKSPKASAVGKPVSFEINKESETFILEFELFGNSETAMQIVDLAEVLKGQGLKLGLSIEGKALERDENNKKIITKTLITGCAITPFPINQDTTAELIKSNSLDFLNINNFNNVEKQELKQMSNNKENISPEAKKAIIDAFGEEKANSLFKSMTSDDLEKSTEPVDSELETLQKGIASKKKELEDMEKEYESKKEKKSEPEKEDKEVKKGIDNDLDNQDNDLLKSIEGLKDIVKSNSDNFKKSIEDVNVNTDNLVKGILVEYEKKHQDQFEKIAKSLVGIYNEIGELRNTPNEPKTQTTDFIKKSIDSGENVANDSVATVDNKDVEVASKRGEICDFLDNRHETEMSKGLDSYDNEYINTVICVNSGIPFSKLDDYQKEKVNEALTALNK